MQSWVICAFVAIAGVFTVAFGVFLLNRRSDAMERGFHNRVANVHNQHYSEMPRSNFGTAVLVMLLGMVLSFGGLISLVVVLQYQGN